jgi:hypothetical protein
MVKTQLMVINRVVLSSIKQIIRKEAERHDYNIYKENHPIVPKQVVIM